MSARLSLIDVQISNTKEKMEQLKREILNAMGKTRVVKINTYNYLQSHLLRLERKR